MASNNPNPLNLLYIIDELGEQARLPSGAIVNIGGVSGQQFTVGGKPVMLADGTLPGGEDVTELKEKLDNHLNADGIKHGAYQISVDTTDLDNISGNNVQQAIESISESLKNGTSNIELVGDVTGISDQGLVITSLSDTSVIPGTYKSVTVDSKGRVIDGYNPTTLDEYGITDALNSMTGGSVAGNVTFSAGSTVKGIPLPDENNDAANKLYVDQKIGDVINGVSWRQAVQVATTTNISLNGLQTIDGQSLEVNQRVLVKNQTAARENGIYVVSEGAWIRAADTDIGAELLNTAVLVLKGATSGLTQWVNTNNGEILIDETDIQFSQLQGSASAYTPGAGLTLSNNKFSITASGVVPGTYTKVTVNALGQVITGSNFNAADLTSILGYTPYNGTTNPNGFLTSSNITAADIGNILGYTPYNGATNNRGFLTAVPNTTYTGDATGTGQGTVALTLAATGVAAGTYTKVTVDVKGRVTTGGNLSDAEINAAIGYTPYNGATNPNGYISNTTQVVLSGDVVGQGFPNIVAGLSATGVVAGTYTKVTVDAKGRVTTGGQLSNAEISSAIGYTPYNAETNTKGFLTTVPTTTYTGDVTGSGQGSVALALAPTGITPGSYAKVTVDAKGRVTSGGNLSSAEINAGLGYVAVNKAGDSLTGALNYAAPISIAATSASTVAGAASNNISISGTGSITTFGSALSGSVRNIRFTGAATLVNGALILPSSSDIVTSVGDYAQFTSLGAGNWRCDVYQKASGEPLVLGGMSPFNTTQVFNGSATQIAMRVKNIAEINKVINGAPASSQVIDLSEGSVYFFTAVATTNWLFNLRYSSSTALNTVMQVGDSVTIAVIVPQGSSAFIANALQIDSTAVTVNWQNREVPVAHPNSIDAYSYVIIKTGNSSYTVLGAQVQYA